jgi:hypothetical protein
MSLAAARFAARDISNSDTANAEISVRNGRLWSDPWYLLVIRGCGGHDISGLKVRVMRGMRTKSGGVTVIRGSLPVRVSV